VRNSHSYVDKCVNPRKAFAVSAGSTSSGLHVEATPASRRINAAFRGNASRQQMCRRARRTTQ